MFRSLHETILQETLKIIEQLIYKNDPELEIHFILISPSLIQLLENVNIKDQVMNCLRLYC